MREGFSFFNCYFLQIKRPHKSVMPLNNLGKSRWCYGFRGSCLHHDIYVNGSHTSNTLLPRTSCQNWKRSGKISGDCGPPRAWFMIYLILIDLKQQVLSQSDLISDIFVAAGLLSDWFSEATLVDPRRCRRVFSSSTGAVESCNTFWRIRSAPWCSVKCFWLCFSSICMTVYPSCIIQ